MSIFLLIWVLQLLKCRVTLTGNPNLEIRDPHSGEISNPKISIEKENGKSQFSFLLNLKPYHSLFLIS